MIKTITMEGVSIIKTEDLNSLILSNQELKEAVMSAISELKDKNKPYLTINEVVSLTGLSRSTINLHRSKIGFTNSGRCVRFKRSDVLEFMEQNYFKTSKIK